MNKKRKQMTCNFTVSYIPLPPERRAAFEHAFDLMADYFFKELERKQKAADLNATLLGSTALSANEENLI